MTHAAVSVHQTERTQGTQPVLGAVKSTYPRIDLSKAAVNDADYSGAAELDAWAQRVFAANGFGDAELAEPAAVSRAQAPAPATTGGRGGFLGAFAVGKAIRAAIDRGVSRWQEYRALRRTYNALADLDARTLKDIGFGDSEAGSIAAELAGRAERTRLQALRSLRELVI